VTLSRLFAGGLLRDTTSGDRSTAPLRACHDARDGNACNCADLKRRDVHVPLAYATARLLPSALCVIATARLDLGMRNFLAVALLFSASLGLAGQEKPVPKDSTRVTLPGCVSGRMFTVMRRETPEPVNSEVALGRHFRLGGKKDMLKEIAQNETMVQVTGLIRKSDVRQTGVGIGGGVRIDPGQPRTPMGGGSSGVGSDPMYNVAGFDVESWTPLPDRCPAR
jgi:hypothetical protein